MTVISAPLEMTDPATVVAPEGCLLVPLTQDKHAIIDEIDAWILNWNWYARKSRGGGYAARWQGGKIIYLHREILRAKTGLDYSTQEMSGDHVNGDRLDCRRHNVRWATKSENQHNQGIHRNNSSGVTGVYWDKSNRKWRAFIHINNRQKTVGYYTNLAEAIAARHIAEIKYHGEFSATLSRRPELPAPPRVFEQLALI